MILKRMIVVVGLISSIFLVGATPALGASSVSVTIDGVNYTCSQGGNGGGNQCECATTGAIGVSGWRWAATKRGVRMDYSEGYTTEADAARACRNWTLNSPNCYK